MTSFANVQPRRVARTPRYFAWSAFAIPVLILTGFAMISTLPVVLISIGAMRDTRVRALRWWVALTSGLFAAAFINWALRADLSVSLTSTLHPAMAAAIVAAALVLIVKIVRRDRNAV